MSVILFSIDCPLFIVSCVHLCVYICVSEHGHAHAVACMANDNNLECQFLLSALGWGHLLVAAEHGRQGGLCVGDSLVSISPSLCEC